jgi:uncharacterized membrane-anchored protein
VLYYINLPRETQSVLARRSGLLCLEQVLAEMGPCEGVIVDHKDRARLVGETHARPTLGIDGPCVVLHEAFLHSDGGAAARAFLTVLCSAAKANPPTPDADLHIIDLPGLTLKWERHGEFSSWTRITSGQGDVANWSDFTGLDTPPGERVSAARIEIVASPAEYTAAVGHEYASSMVSGGAAQLWTDLAMRPDGFVGYTLATAFSGDEMMGPPRLGRLVRRICEIETYRIFAMLAFPVARAVRGDLNRLDKIVSGAFDEGAGSDRDVLTSLTNAAQDVERLLTETDFRFGAGAAYRDLVETRIGELREVRIEGQQRLGKFLDRRFTPAMATVATTRARLEALATRIERACSLLRTRVDLSLQQQNQELLRSMDMRAQLQLRLQETVEGFSVVAISYYAVMLLSKVAHGFFEPLAERYHIPTGWIDGALVVLVIGSVWAALRGMRKNLTKT